MRARLKTVVVRRNITATIDRNGPGYLEGRGGTGCAAQPTAFTLKRNDSWRSDGAVPTRTLLTMPCRSSAKYLSVAPVSWRAIMLVGSFLPSAIRPGVIAKGWSVTELSFGNPRSIAA